MVNGNYSFERENGSEIALIAGWGRTAFNGEFSDDLIEARLHVFPHSECLKALEAYTKITAQHICAKAPHYSLNPSDACPGDSGGPLVQLDEKSEQYILTGVISFGKRCALKKFPGVYARVEYFSNWIKRKLKYKRPRS